MKILTTPIEKLNNPWVQTKLDSNGITVGYIGHPTQQEVVDKFNELIEATNKITEWIEAKKDQLL